MKNTPIGKLDTNKAPKIHKGSHRVHHLAIEERGLFDDRPLGSTEGPKELLKNFKERVSANRWSFGLCLFWKTPRDHLTGLEGTSRNKMSPLKKHWTTIRTRLDGPCSSSNHPMRWNTIPEKANSVSDKDTHFNWKRYCPLVSHWENESPMGVRGAS